MDRKHFFWITLVMLVLFGIFMVTGMLKEYGSEYDKNAYAGEASAVSQMGTPAKNRSGKTVILVGDEQDGQTGRMVQLWSEYQKMDFLCRGSLSAVTREEAAGAELLFLDSAYLDFDSDTATLCSFAEQGISMVFCNLPEVSVLKENEELLNLLGIYYVYMDDVELTGVEIYDGFLLGGDDIYQAETEEEEEQQDLDLHVPWYSVYMGTKTYITGLLDKEDYGGENMLSNEALPAIVWRNSIGDARIFVVSGDYSRDVTALGLYSGMLYEMREYALYPVVNAQNFIVANLAALSSEQDEVTGELYSRSQKVTFQDLIWPGISEVCTKSQEIPTFFLNPKLDYSSSEMPVRLGVEFYQKLFCEMRGENGLTLFQTSAVSAADKLKIDREIYDAYMPDYVFRALYAGTEEAYASVQDEDTLQGIRTVCMGVDCDEEPVGYVADGVTGQRATVDGFSHTYSDDLRLKSLETALGYSNILVDLQRVVMPESEDDHWENLLERLSRYTVTCRKPFTAFTKTTASESDARIRAFLGLDYQESRSGDVITLQIEQMEDQASFLLRTHNEIIDEAEGASWSEIEDGAYLIEAEASTVKIHVKKDQTTYYENH